MYQLYMKHIWVFGTLLLLTGCKSRIRGDVSGYLTAIIIVAFIMAIIGAFVAMFHPDSDNQANGIKVSIASIIILVILIIIA